MQNQFSLDKHCENCGESLIYVDHYEYDGVTEYGSHEPYWECLNRCAYPECADWELTPEELAERNKVDTLTEFGIVELQEERGAILL